MEMLALLLLLVICAIAVSLIVKIVRGAVHFIVVLLAVIAVGSILLYLVSPLTFETITFKLVQHIP
jgi:hypothetical protein